MKFHRKFARSTAKPIAAIAGFSAAALLSLTAAATPWTANVSKTALGAHVIGNPAAKVNLVEYFSYTCGACGNFATQSGPLLDAQYVANGKVKVEYRNLVRDPLDLTAALLARCGRSTAFYGNHQAIFAAQANWMDKVQRATEAQVKSWSEGDAARRTQNIAKDSGLFALMQQRGYSDSQLNACLADDASMKALTAMTNMGRTTDRVRSTPSFILQGKLVSSNEWSALKSALDAALKGA